MARDLNRPLVGFGAAHRIERVLEIAGRKRRKLCGKLGSRAVRELPGRGVIGKLCRLFTDRIRDFGTSMAHVHHRETREAVDELPAGSGPNVHALPALDQ
jgi:hypothetical protein